MSEACRIGIHYKAPGVVDVGAPMKHKPLCYEILADAREVIARLGEQHFKPGVTAMAVVMDMTGRVDVMAPLPPREQAYQWLQLARDVIGRYNDDSAPEMRAFSDVVMGGA